MCKTSELMRDIAVLTYFKQNKPMFKEEYAIRQEAYDHVVAYGESIVKEELIQRQYFDLLNKLSQFESMHPHVVGDNQE